MVNAPRFFYMAFNMVKPFLSERIRSSVSFHPSLDDLHEEVSKEVTAHT